MYAKRDGIAPDKKVNVIWALSLDKKHYGAQAWETLIK
jgi:hypothetical protein